MSEVTESIFDGETVIIPMKEVQYIERDTREGYTDAIKIVLTGSTWNSEIDFFNNTPYLRGNEAESFIRAWCRYRSELEVDDHIDIMGDTLFPGIKDQLEKLGD